MTQDVVGQRLTALLFPALTKQDSRLRVQGDLADRWTSDAHHRVWRFHIRPGLVDHGNQPMTAQALLECFENYRQGKPKALAILALQGWRSTKADGQSITFELEKSDPNFPRNATLLRYFRKEGRPACEDPSQHPGQPMIGAREFRAKVETHPPESELLVERLQPDGSFRPHARFLFVRDENTRILRMLLGEADVTQNSFSPVRFRWLQKNHASQFELTEAPGVNVSYLSFNTTHPLLAQKKVRQAIALSVPIHDLIEGKFAGMVEEASSFLSPQLEDATSPVMARDNLFTAEKLLDEAGLRRNASGIRFSLRFKTTPQREGFEPARILQERLSKIGIQTTLEVVEPAVFLASIRRGAYELCLGRWVGVADASILERTLRTGNPSNRARYSNLKMDEHLDHQQWKEVQTLMVEDLPYFPLWFWKNAVLTRKEFQPLSPEQVSMSGGLRPLLEIRRKENFDAKVRSQ